MPLHIFLTQGLLPSALAVARSLHGAGHRVTLGDHDGSVIARFSRHVSAFVRLPAPMPDPRRYVEAVRDAASRVRADVVLPLFEEGFLLAAYWNAQMPNPSVMPPFELALSLADKGTGVAAAGEAGLPIATTLLADAPAAQLGEALGYPLVLKPRLSTSGVGVRIARDASELSRLRASLAEPSAYVAQRWAGKRELVFQGVFDKGRCIAAHAYRVVCRHPPDHGFGILLESVCDEALLGYGIRFGEHMGYHGALGLDFLADEEGVMRVVECNPRLVLGVVNAVDAGVPIPARVAELGRIKHETVTAKQPGYAAGVRSLHWPAQAVTEATGQSMASQLAGWSRQKLEDPGALAAFMAHVVIHRLRGGFEPLTLEDRSLSSALAKRLVEDRAHAGS